MADMNPEQLKTEKRIEVSPNMISIKEVDQTFNNLMVKFTGENYKQFVEAAQGNVDTEQTIEKAKKGKVRGAVVPLVATGFGIGAGYMVNSMPYKLGKAYAEISGSVPSPVFATFSLLEKLSPPVIASLGAGVSTLTASAIRRGFGENVFEYYSRYSHMDAEGNFLTKPIKKIWNWYARGLEHAAFNTFVLNPAEPAAKVIELIDESKREDFDNAFAQLQRKDVEDRVAKGYMHLVSSEATKYYGAEFNEEERKKIDFFTTEVKGAIEKYTSRIPDNEKVSFQENIYNRVVKEEKIRYLLATGLMSGASAIKAFGLGSIFELVHDYVLPQIIPGVEKVKTDDITPTQATVTQPATVEAPSKVIESVAASETVGQPVLDNPKVAEAGWGIVRDRAQQPVDTTAVTSLGNYTGVNRGLGDLEILANPAPVAAGIPKLELQVTGTQSALDTLPSISASGAIEGASTVGSLLTIKEGMDLLYKLSAENPEAIVAAWLQIAENPDPAMPEAVKDLIGSVGGSAPEIMAALQSAGPQGLWLLNKLFQGAACLGSISAGGVACPALAGP
jgi:hypothetical protein